MGNRHRLSAALSAALLTFTLAGVAFAGSLSMSGGDGAVAGARDCGIVPLDVELILDNSGSMGNNSSNGKTRLEWAKISAKQLVDDLDGSGLAVGGTGHHVGVTRFSGTTASVVQSLTDAPGDAADVKAAIDSLSSSGNTPVDAGMAAGAGDLSASGRAGVKGVAIILSDGRPWPDQGPEGNWATTYGPRPNASEGSAYLGSADVAITVALGQGGTNGTANEVDLALMALLGPDGAYNVVNGGELPNVFSAIYEQIACPPNLTAHKSVDKSSADPGDTLNYTISLTNDGGTDATSVEVHDDISALLAHGTFGTCDNGCTNDADSVDWTGLTVPMGGSLDLGFSIVLDADGWPVGTTHLANTVVVGDTNCAADTQDPKCTTDTGVTYEEPVTEPPVIEPPVTEPPVTEPPVTEPPISEPPVTEPPITDPPQPTPTFGQSFSDSTVAPTLPDTAGGGTTAQVSADNAWLLVVALAMILSFVVVLTPAPARTRR